MEAAKSEATVDNMERFRLDTVAAVLGLVDQDDTNVSMVILIFNTSVRSA